MYKVIAVVTILDKAFFVKPKIPLTLSGAFSKAISFFSKKEQQFSYDDMLSYCNDLTVNMSSLFQELSDDTIKQYSYEALKELIYNMRRLLTEQFNKEIQTVKQKHLKDINGAIIRQLVSNLEQTSYDDFLSSIDVINSSKFRLILDRSLNLTDLSYNKIPKLLRSMIAKLMKVRGKQACFMVLMALKTVVATLDRELIDEEIDHLWSLFHSIAVLKPNKQGILDCLSSEGLNSEKLTLVDDSFKTLINNGADVNRGFFNFPGLINLILSCRNLDFVQTALDPHCQLMMSVSDDFTQEKWVSLKASIFILYKLQSDKGSDDNLAFVLQQLQTKLIDCEGFSYITLDRKPLDLRVIDTKRAERSPSPEFV